MSTVRKILDRNRKPAAKPRTTIADEAAAAQAAETEERYKRKLAELEARAVKAERAHAQAEAAARKTSEERDAERVRAAIVRAANAKHALDPDEIADLLHRKVALRDGKIVSADDPEKDVDAVVGGYLESKPHHVRAQVAQGSGAPTIAGRAPTPPAPANHDRTNRDGATAAFREALLKTAKLPS
jgi:hypothetical protein